MNNELKKFHKALFKLTEKLSTDPISAFQHFLEYSISICSFSFKKDMTMYSKEIIQLFYTVFCEWIQLQNFMLTKKNLEWFDAFGTYYEEYSSSWSKKNKGQFFTPPNLCDLMVQCMINKESSKLNIPDPACGSGRLLIASHAYNPKNFHYASDIDYLCCLMACLNMMIHGVQGEVVCKNALNWDDYRIGWKINPNISLNKGIPHIEVMKKENSFIYYQDQKVKEQKMKEQTDKEMKVNTNSFFNTNLSYNDLFNEKNNANLDF